MRLDKFLKVSRLVKRRTVAKEVCDQGRVQVNGRPAKAGTEVGPGDVLTIAYGGRTLTVRVERVGDHVPKEAAAGLYTVLEERRVSGGISPEEEDLEDIR